MYDQNGKDRREISEFPPMSRLFIICGRNVSQETLTEHFQDDGEIEECVVIKDKNTGQGKGIAYVKFSRTSAAAQGLKKNGTFLKGETRPIKVMISASYQKRKEEGGQPEEVQEFKFRRLFAVIPSTKDEETIRKEFGRFGTITQARLVQDKKNQNQCAAYITFTTFLETALAIEGCDASYRAKFCLPRDQLKNNSGGGDGDNYSNGGPPRKRTHSPSSKRGAQGGGIDVKLVVICSSDLNQDRLWRIFDIAPGMKYCNIVTQNDINTTASVVYSSKEDAQRAVDKIHGLEYPIGERVIVRYEDEFREEVVSHDALSQLGPSKPMLNPQTTQCVKKAFFICMPEAIPVRVLQDAFCRFGDLINVHLVPNRRHGYAEFASDVAADRAIQQLHGMQIGDCRLKVLECMEQNDRQKRQRMEH